METPPHPACPASPCPSTHTSFQEPATCRASAPRGLPPGATGVRSRLQTLGAHRGPRTGMKNHSGGSTEVPCALQENNVQCKPLSHKAGALRVASTPLSDTHSRVSTPSREHPTPWAACTAAPGIRALPMEPSTRPHPVIFHPVTTLPQTRARG